MAETARNRWRFENVAVVEIEVDAKGTPTIVIHMQEGPAQIVVVEPRVDTSVFEDRSTHNPIWSRSLGSPQSAPAEKASNEK